MDSLKKALLCAALIVLPVLGSKAEPSELARSFKTPPDEARPWCWWGWMNGDVTREGIVRDLDHLVKVGFGGVRISQDGRGTTKRHNAFLSPEWRALFKFAVEEAAKRNLVLGMTPCNGFNAGGPWIKAEDGPHFLDSSSVTCKGPGKVTLKLPAPKTKETVFYQDIAVLAWRVVNERTGTVDSKSMVDLTSLLKEDTLEWDAPQGNWTVMRFASRNSSNEHACYIKLGDFWTKGPGTLTKDASGKPLKQWELDPLKSEPMDLHFANTVEILAKDVGEHTGKTFKFIQLDSSEIGTPDWTGNLREEFKHRRGYDMFPFLASRSVKQTVDSREITERFREDMNRTLGELMVEKYYGRLTELAHRHGLQTSSQGAGQQKPRLDALASLGLNDMSEGEYWTRGVEPPSPETAIKQPSYPHANMTAPDYVHQLSEPLLLNHDSVRTAASAAHIYGRDIVTAEACSRNNQQSGLFNGYTTYPYGIKDVGDRAFCAGLNRNLFLFFIHQPDDDIPGNSLPRWGTDFSRNLTWWPMGKAWTTYISRCQYLLQSSRFTADVCYFPGEWVPNYIPARWANNPELPPGFDCDTVNAEVLRQSGVGQDGRLELKSGMRYRYLVFRRGGPWKFTNKMTRHQVLDEQEPMVISPGTLSKIKTLVEGGMTLVGSRPSRAIGLTDYPKSDAEVARLADELWGKESKDSGDRKVGKGRVIWGKPLAELFAADGVKADLEIKEDAATAALPAETLSNIPNPTGSFDWIHRTVGKMDIYFIANLRKVDAAGDFTFRVNGRKPELWDPVTGTIRDLPQASETKDGRIALPIKFAARQSFFVVFRDKEEKAPDGAEQFPTLVKLQEVTGPWEVQFDAKWFYPDTTNCGGKVQFERLTDWKDHPDTAVKHFSGTAVYRKQLSWKGTVPTSGLYLDIGLVRPMARVRLNGQDLGVIWTAPWRVDIAPALKTGDNQLEIEVVNLWGNRIIGDAGLPAEQRRTKHNYPDTKVKPDMPLFSSGLLGPVTISAAEK